MEFRTKRINLLPWWELISVEAKLNKSNLQILRNPTKTAMGFPWLLRVDVKCLPSTLGHFFVPIKITILGGKGHTGILKIPIFSLRELSKHSRGRFGSERGERQKLQHLLTKICSIYSSVLCTLNTLTLPARQGQAGISGMNLQPS